MEIFFNESHFFDLKLHTFEKVSGRNIKKYQKIIQGTKSNGL